MKTIEPSNELVGRARLRESRKFRTFEGRRALVFHCHCARDFSLRTSDDTFFVSREKRYVILYHMEQLQFHVGNGRSYSVTDKKHGENHRVCHLRSRKHPRNHQEDHSVGHSRSLNRSRPTVTHRIDGFRGTIRGWCLYFHSRLSAGISASGGGIRNSRTDSWYSDDFYLCKFPALGDLSARSFSPDVGFLEGHVSTEQEIHERTRD